MPQTLSVEAMPFTFFMLLDHFVALQIVVATAFLRSSYGHPQAQTVPSTTWVAPCPVVTPSRIGLGSALSAYNYDILLGCIVEQFLSYLLDLKHLQ